MGKKKHSGNILYKIFIYVALLALAISIIIPVLWVFMASVKRNAEFIGADVNPWHFRSSSSIRTLLWHSAMRRWEISSSTRLLSLHWD